MEEAKAPGNLWRGHSGGKPQKRKAGVLNVSALGFSRREKGGIALLKWAVAEQSESLLDEGESERERSLRIQPTGIRSYVMYAQYCSSMDLKTPFMILKKSI